MGRCRHHVSWKQRFAAAPQSAPDSATPLQKMVYRLKTPNKHPNRQQPVPGSPRNQERYLNATTDGFGMLCITV